MKMQLVQRRLPVFQWSALPVLLLFLWIAVMGDIVTITTVSALHSEEAGQLDFWIASTGHGPVTWVSNVVESSTSLSAAVVTGRRDRCYVASRRVKDGSMLWRRNVCSRSSSSSSTTTGISTEFIASSVTDRFYTMDVSFGPSHTLRAWSIDSGTLLWETTTEPLYSLTTKTRAATIVTAKNRKNPSSASLQLLHVFIHNEREYVAIEEQIFDSTTGSLREDLVEQQSRKHRPSTVMRDSSDGADNNKSSSTFVQCPAAQWAVGVVEQPPDRVSHTNNRILTALPIASSSDHDEMRIIIPWSPFWQSKMATTESSESGNGKEKGSDVNSDPIALVSLVTCTSERVQVLVCSQKGTTSMVSLFVKESSASTPLFVSSRIDWSREEGLGIIDSALLLDASHDLRVDPTQVRVETLLSFSSRLQSQWQSFCDSCRSLSRFFSNVLSSQADHPQQQQQQQQQQQHKHLFGFAKTAVLLSNSVQRVWGMDTFGPSRGRIQYQLDLPHNALRSVLVHGGSMTWTAMTHAAVANASHYHSSHVLIVSTTATTASEDPYHHNERLHWICLDGITGIVIDQSSDDADAAASTNAATTLLSSSIAQVIPLDSDETDTTTTASHSAATTKCHQKALLLLNDGSVVSIPPMIDGKPPPLPASGMYVHTLVSNNNNIDGEHNQQQPEKEEEGKRKITINNAAGITTFYISSGDDKIHTQQIGSTLLPNEEIVRVVYPRREESMESPCHAQGDHSVLLKYLNPHLVAVISMTKSQGVSTSSSITTTTSAGSNKIDDAFYAVTTKSSAASKNNVKQQRKPLGATSDSSSSALGESATASIHTESSTHGSASFAPNLFLNVIDTVSGRLLYRIGHSHAVPYPRPTATISENWIYYSFANAKTRRAEVGVLSLYEGMIDPKSLTAFTSPDLASNRAFSSFDVQASKPVVLAKTYSIPRPVTALGVTLTKHGISGKRLVLAGVDGRVYTIDNIVLEPRRPVGPLKESEKQEGLSQYSEFIPLVPYLVLSYNRTVEGVSHIVTAATDLESQTLVMALGGPDLFFTRMSPSRGFDLLPDTFNRIVLSLVLLGLAIVTAALRRRVARKMQQQSWR